MNARFDELSRREQLTLIIGGVALALMLFYTLIWAPLSEERNRLHHQVVTQQETLSWMKQASDQVKNSGVSGQKTVRSGESLLTLVDRSAKTAKMGGTIKRIQPDKNGSVRIWLEGVNFDLMMQWLGGLSRDKGVVLAEVNVERFESSALVKSRLTLKRAK